MRYAILIIHLLSIYIETWHAYIYSINAYVRYHIKHSHIERRGTPRLYVCVEMMCKLWMIVWGLENNLYIREIINKTCNYEGL